VLASAVLLTAAVRAQSMTGTIEGMTVDASGASVAGVVIDLVGARHRAISGADGSYRLTSHLGGSGIGKGRLR
jgi:hypothetical protein